MEFNKVEVAVIAKAVEEGNEALVTELAELHLLLIGGGVGEVILA
jgi:hypothetical protein